MHMKNIFLLLSLLSLFFCKEGPEAALNEDFEYVDASKPLPFEKLVGLYKLDEDSKKRYNIPLDLDLTLDIKIDKTFVANNYLEPKTHQLHNKNLISFFYYHNDYKEKHPTISIFSDESVFFNNINIYYRKKDSVLALYIYTPPPKGQEHGDYLRYIKVK